MYVLRLNTILICIRYYVILYINWMFTFLKVVQIFAITLIYLIRSYKKDQNIILLKKRWADEILHRLGFEVHLSGQLSTEEKLICVGNHVSFVDILVLISANPNTIFVSKKEVSQWPIIGHGAKKIKTIFLDRNNRHSSMDVRKQIANALLNENSSPNEKRHLAIFPSGTTSLFEDVPWKPGAFNIAQSTQIKIQPFRLTYEPLRECAYIDDDHLIHTMSLILKTSHKKIYFQWGEARFVSDPIQQSEELRRWSSFQLRTEVNPILHLVLT